MSFGTTALSGSLPPGTQLNGIYCIDSRLASGGMGEIYRGHELQTDEPVAIKFIREDMADDEAALALFRKEASALNRIHHEAIVRYLVFSLDPVLQRHYLAMELVEGESLSDLLRRGPLSTNEVVALIRRIGSGLQAAHDRDVVHRDMSPDNIIVKNRDFARARIIDFGIARSTRVGDQTVIGGGFAGKYNYVSPEQLGMFGADINGKSDIYSVGLVAAQCLRGQPIDMGGSQVDIIDKRRKVPDLSDIDPRIRPLIEWMLQPDPEDRPARMEDVVRWTAGAAEDEKTAIVLKKPVTKATPAAKAETVSRYTPPPPPTPSRSFPAPAAQAKSGSKGVIIGIAAAAVLAGGGFVAWLQLSGPPPSPVKPPVQDAGLGPSPGNTGPLSGPGDSAPNTPPREDATRPQTPVPSTPPVTAAKSPIARFAHDFNGGDCYFAAARQESAAKVRIDGFGLNAAPFQQLEDATKRRFNVDPDIELRLVNQAHCPALAFAHALPFDDARMPSLALDTDVVKNNSEVWGTVEVQDDNVDLLLIDETGRVQSATPALDASGVKRRFGIRLQRRNAQNFPLRMLFMVVSSAQPISALKPERPLPAKEFFDRLTAATAGSANPPTATFAYLRLVE